MKDRECVTTNGRAVFYAAMWEDLRKAATNCGWALALHGSLNTDMDIIAMRWDENAGTVEEMIEALCDCFNGNSSLERVVTPFYNKPWDRMVYTIPIWADFYLDINVVNTEAQTYQLCNQKT